MLAGDAYDLGLDDGSGDSATTGDIDDARYCLGDDGLELALGADRVAYAEAFDGDAYDLDLDDGSGD